MRAALASQLWVDLISARAERGSEGPSRPTLSPSPRPVVVGRVCDGVTLSARQGTDVLYRCVGIDVPTLRRREGPMNSVRYPSLYQINTRVWLTELLRTLGRRRARLGSGPTPRIVNRHRCRRRPERLNYDLIHCPGPPREGLTRCATARRGRPAQGRPAAPM